MQDKLKYIHAEAALGCHAAEGEKKKNVHREEVTEEERQKEREESERREMAPNVPII